mgnify:CR=1 FL=1
MTAPVLCEFCNKEIKEREDLTLAAGGFRIKPYHEFCYGKDAKRDNILFMSHPLNGMTGMISYLITFVLTLVFYFTGTFIKYIVFIYFVIETCLRLYAVYFIWKKFSGTRT